MSQYNLKTSSTVKVGKVSISQEKAGNYKLRFSSNGQRYSHGLGNLETKKQWSAITDICQKIDIDLRIGKFNKESWKSDYFGILNGKSERNLAPIPTTINLKSIWENYKSINHETANPVTIKTTWHLIDQRIATIENTDSSLLEIENIEDFINTLKSKYALTTVIVDLVTINAAINLAIKQKKITHNPLSVILSAMQKTRVKKKVKAYSVEETKQIIECFYNCNYLIKCHERKLKDGTQKIYYFRNSKAIALHYAPLIEFRFLTGCRPSEAFALTWDDIIVEGKRSYIRFNKVYRDGHLLEGTKNGVETRLFPINNQLKNLVEKIPKNPSKNNLIFTA